MKLVRNGKTNPNPQFDGGGRVSLFYLYVITCSFGHVSAIRSCLADIAVGTVQEGLMFCAFRLCRQPGEMILLWAGCTFS